MLQSKGAIFYKLTQVKSCQSIHELIVLYDKHDKSPILESRRHLYFDQLRVGSLFGMGYSTLKKNFIEAL